LGTSIVGSKNLRCQNGMNKKISCSHQSPDSTIHEYGNANFQYGYGYQFEKQTMTYPSVCENRRVSCIECQICYINTKLIYPKFTSNVRHITSITRNYNISIFEMASICFMFNCLDIYSKGERCMRTLLSFSPPSQS
jgi:hypothetical protein